jgi:hypothetical protein
MKTTKSKKENALTERPWDLIPMKMDDETLQTKGLLESLILGYESQAFKVLKDQGYPQNLNDLWAIRKNNMPVQIRDILNMLSLFKQTRQMVKINSAPLAAFYMALAIQSATRAQMRFYEPAIERGIPFIHGNKQSRHDNLSKAMIHAWKTFEKEAGGKPSCRNIFDWIEVKGKIQEKDTETEIIYWIDGSKKEQKTNYGAFKNRYTKIKQEMTEK